MLGVSGETETKYYYHQNNLYSVGALTDSSGAVVERYAYSAYGTPIILAPDGSTVRSTSTVSNPYLFTGRRLDSETGLQYSRARYYDFNLGRFIGRDPIAADVNLYSYCDNNSLMYVDPNGLRALITEETALAISRDLAQATTHAEALSRARWWALFLQQIGIGITANEIVREYWNPPQPPQPQPPVQPDQPPVCEPKPAPQPAPEPTPEPEPIPIPVNPPPPPPPPPQKKTCATEYPGWENCAFYSYSSIKETISGDYGSNAKIIVGPKTKAKKCGTGGGWHWNLFTPGKYRRFIGSVICCNCCEDTPIGPKIGVGCNSQ